MTFETWAKGRPLGPKDSMGYQMAKAAWDAAIEEAAKACEANAIEQQVMVLHSISDTFRSVHSRECAALVLTLKS